MTIQLYATIAFAIVAVIGLLISWYISSRSVAKKSLVCPIGGSCDALLNGKWGSLWGVKNEVWGMLFYTLTLVCLVGAYLIPAYAPLLVTYLVILVGIGLLYTLYLVFIETFVERTVCFWCTCSALCVVMLGGLTIVLL